MNLWLRHRQTSNDGAAVKDIHLLVDGPLTLSLGYACRGSLASRLLVVSVYVRAGRSHFRETDRASLIDCSSSSESHSSISSEASYFSDNVKLNMAGGLAKEVIILIVIVASGASVLIAWAIHSIWHGQRGGDEEGLVSDSEQQQAAYRQEVRMRNQENMAAINGFKFPSHRYDED